MRNDLAQTLHHYLTQVDFGYSANADEIDLDSFRKAQAYCNAAVQDPLTSTTHESEGE